MSRFATEQDKSTFAPFLEPNEIAITPGKDYIFDAPTKPSENGRIWLTKVEEQLTGLQDGSKIFFDSAKLQNWQCIILTNETLGRPWPWLDISFIGIPNGRMAMQRGQYSYNGDMFKITGVRGEN